MTKFFKTLEELKASLPTTVNLMPRNAYSLTPEVIQGINLAAGIAQSQQTTFIVNGNNLEQYIYTPSLSILSPAWAKSVTYDFKLVDSCPISNYKSLVQSKDAFETNLPKQYDREWSFFTDKQQRQDGMFFAPKTAIVTNGDKFQEIKYTLIPGECIKEGWFGSGVLEVEYQSEVVSEAPISEVLAEFGL